jgi:YgiT-type zinc finger domain-containing protein
MKKQSIRCPTCGAPGMRRVARDVTTRAGRRAVIVRGVEVEECQRCGERLYDLAALHALRESRRAVKPRRPAA